MWADIEQVRLLLVQTKTSCEQVLGQPAEFLWYRITRDYGQHTGIASTGTHLIRESVQSVPQGWCGDISAPRAADTGGGSGTPEPSLALPDELLSWSTVHASVFARAIKRPPRRLHRNHRVKSVELLWFPVGTPFRDYVLECPEVRERSFAGPRA